MIIGVMGTIGSGKDAVVNYLVDKYKHKFISFGDMLRDEFKKNRMNITREGLTSYQKESIQKFGEDYWIKKVITQIKKNKWKNVAISGIRYPIDIQMLNKEFGQNFISVKVDATPYLRYTRMKKRGREDAPKTYTQFQKQELLEAKSFQLKKTFSYTNFVVKNNSTLAKLYAQVDEIMLTIKHKK